MDTTEGYYVYATLKSEGPCPNGTHVLRRVGTSQTWSCQRCVYITGEGPIDREPPPSYRDLIEVPEHYHLWGETFASNIVLTVCLDRNEDTDSTWLRKHAFSDTEWRAISKTDWHDEMFADKANETRGKIQQRVNDIVTSWRKDFGAP